MPFPDALQEFSVESGVRSARFGSSTGATVNAVTRSGTNRFHGSAFVFGRHHMFNSIRYFDRTENGGLGRDDGLKRAQSGGTFGGPVVRDKLFFFGGIQVTNERIAPIANDQIVPTEEVRRGDFRRIMSARLPGRDGPNARARRTSNNQINPALYHPISLKIMSMLPMPDPSLDPDGCGRYVLAIPNNSDEQQYIGRMDYQMSAKHRVFGRGFYTKYLHAPLFDPSNPNLLMASGNGGGNDARIATFAGGWDYVIRPNLLSSTRVVVPGHGDAATPGATAFRPGRRLGVNTFQYTRGNGQDFLRNGTAGWSSNQLTGAFYVATPSLSQDFDWNAGSHSLSFGGSWTRPHSDGDGTFQSNGQFTFSGLITSGTGNANGGLNMADWVLGLPSAFSQGGSQINDQVLNTVALYVADVWRASSRLTINAGVRWEPYFAARDQNNFTTAFIRDNFDRGIRSTVYTNAPVGMVFPGDPGFPNNKANNYRCAEAVRAARGDRLGSEGRHPADDSRRHRPLLRCAEVVAVRASHAQSALRQHHERPAARRRAPCRTAMVARSTSPIRGRYTPGGDPLKAINYPRQGDPVTLPPSGVAFPFQGDYVSMPVNVEPMRMTQWNLAVRTAVAAAHADGRDLHGQRDRQHLARLPGEPGDLHSGQLSGRDSIALTAAGPCSNTSAANRQARALLTLLNPSEGPKYLVNGVAQTYDQGTGTYHGVRFGLQKRMASGWSMNANYTLSECISQGEPGTDIGNTFPVPLIDPINNPKPDASTNEGPCAADRRHNFNLSSVFLSPGVGDGVWRALTKDWQIGLIYQVRSGSALTPSTTGDTALTGLPQRPMIVEGVDPYLAEDERFWVNPRELQWFNMAAFAQNPPGVWGNTPRGYLRGPGFWNVDLALSRNLTLAPGQRLEMRVEAFNLFDTVNWGNPNVTLASATQGRITSTAGDARIMQFALKYGF